MQSKEYIELVLKKYGVTVPSNLINVFNEFVNEPSSVECVNIIIEKQMQILNSWKIKNRIVDITNQQIILPNASIDKPYSTKLDIEKYNLQESPQQIPSFCVLFINDFIVGELLNSV